MDVNGSRYHLLMGARDWLPRLEARAQADLWWDDLRASVSLAPRLTRFPRRAGEAPPTLADRRGAGCDRFGNLHWIGPDSRTIRFLPAGTSGAGTFWSVEDLRAACAEPPEAGDFRPCAEPEPVPAPRLRGLAVTETHYLVVGTLEPAGLLIFDLHAGGPPLWLRWPDPIPFAPFDLAPAPGGGVWILDRGPATGESRYWRLDRYLRVVPAGIGAGTELAPPTRDDFKPVGGTPRERPGRRFPLGISLGMASPVEVAEPVAILGLPDDSVLILETDPAAPASVVHRFHNGRKVNEIPLEGELLEQLLAEPRVRGHDFAFLPSADAPPGTVAGELFVVAADGNQAFGFGLEAEADALTLVLRPRYLPLRRFTGKALVAAATEVLYDLEERWLPLTEQPRPRFVTEATLKGLTFDGKGPDCVWHRLLLDACIAPGDAITVESRTADEPELLVESEWFREPELYLRADGSELPFHQPLGGLELERAGAGTWEVLFQNARGRYLELRLTLRGNGRSTPRLSALRVWYPRFSYLEQYLPAVYRDDPVSAHFLDRFLSNPEGLLTALEGHVAQAEGLFDTRTAPPEYLDWLACWLGAILEPDWDDARRRLFIAHAELLFRWRGTPAGLLAAIRLAIDPCPDEGIFEGLASGAGTPVGSFGGDSVRIVEHFLNRKFPGVTLGDPRQLEQPALVAADAPYEPAQGPAPLHQRFRDFLRRRYGTEGGADSEALQGLNQAWETTRTAFEQLQFPPVLPEEDAVAADWQAFTEGGIGFTYATVTLDDEPLYRDFLARRFRRIGALNEAYQLTGDQAHGSFAEIGLPVQLPENRRRLADWIGFVSLALPLHRNAHRFTVLVPTAPSESLAAREQRLAQVRAIVEREKPAHTEFDVQLFWALFQVGGARLGLDTILGEGSRYVALVLSSGFLGQSFLAESHPWNVNDRLVVGRDPVMES